MFFSQNASPKHRCKKYRESEGVGEAPMPPEILVADAKPKSDHIEVGNHGADDPSYPHLFRYVRSIERRADCRRGDCM